MALGRPLGAKLFLEGKEVPFIGATITSTVGQASIAYVDLVPHYTINNIKPRTHVTIAIRDYNNTKDEFPYVLAWEGEVFGVNFSKTPSSRSFSISCIDVSSYWDNALSYFLNPTTSLGKGGADMVGLGLDVATAKASGINVVPTSDSISSYFLQTVKEMGADGDFLKGFAGVYKTMTNINKFYENAEKRLRIYDRVVIKSSAGLTELLKGDEAFKWFEGVLGKESGFSTLRTVIQDLMSLIFHDFVSIPFPARVEKSDLASPSVPAGTENKKYTVGELVFKPNLYMIPPPACNIFFPDEYSNFSFSRNFFHEPTRLLYKPEMPVFLSSQKVALSYHFEPASYFNYMMGNKNASEFGGADDFAAAVSPGKFGDPDNDPQTSKTNNKKLREAQFLTNEEKIKGIWMAIEQMVPASNTFTSEFKDKNAFIANIGKYLFYKKRFENRQLQITSHLKLSVVPGFNVLLLDDSDSNQNMLAYCSSVSHRIFATEGGYTNVVLSYARTTEEEKSASKNGNDPLVPPWFDPEIFGAVTKPPPSKSAKTKLSTKGQVYVTPDNKLSEYYRAILGSKGYKALTNLYKDEKTVIGSVEKLLSEYRAKKLNADTLQEFIAQTTGRDYIRIRDFFRFLGAELNMEPENVSTKTKTSSVKVTDVRNSEFNVFKGGPFNTENKDFGDILKTKLEPINAYVEALKGSRGFRG